MNALYVAPTPYENSTLSAAIQLVGITPALGRGSAAIFANPNSISETVTELLPQAKFAENNIGPNDRGNFVIQFPNSVPTFNVGLCWLILNSGGSLAQAFFSM